MNPLVTESPVSMPDPSLASPRNSTSPSLGGPHVTAGRNGAMQNDARWKSGDSSSLRTKEPKSLPTTLNYWHEIWNKRFFWSALVRNDLRTRYRRSWLGLGWSLLNPICMTGVICLVFSNIFAMDVVDFVPHVLSGLIVWSYFTAITTDGALCFLNGSRFIRQYPAPLAIYPLRATLVAMLHLLIAVGILLGLVWTTHGFANLPVLWTIVPSLILILALGWAVSMVLGALTIVFHDVQHIVQILMQFCFYMTPVFYPESMLATRGFGWVVDWNPFLVFIKLLRMPIVEGEAPTLFMYGMALAIVGMVALTGWFMHRRFERRMIYLL